MLTSLTVVLNLNLAWLEWAVAKVTSIVLAILNAGQIIANLLSLGLAVGGSGTALLIVVKVNHYSLYKFKIMFML